MAAQSPDGGASRAGLGDPPGVRWEPGRQRGRQNCLRSVGPDAGTFSQHIGSGNIVEQAGRRHVGGARDLSQIHSSPEDLERGLRPERLTHLLDSQWASASYRQPPRHSTDSPGVLAMANGDWQQRVIGLLFLLYKTRSRIMAATLFSTRDGPDVLLKATTLWDRCHVPVLKMRKLRF